MSYPDLERKPFEGVEEEPEENRKVEEVIPNESRRKSFKFHQVPLVQELLWAL